MSIKTKWVGLGAYDLRLFLIKNRFFVAGSGIDKNTDKLLALGFREVPKSAFKAGARSYWSTPSESGLLRRIVAAFPEYTVELLPPEGINPTILVNRNQNFKGGIRNDDQRDRQRPSDSGQPVDATADRDSHVGTDPSATVLGGANPSDDSRDQPGDDIGAGGERELPTVAGEDEGGLRTDGAELSGSVEEAQPTIGGSDSPRAGELAQSGEDGQSGSVPEQPSAELAADPTDGGRGELLLSDASAIRAAMDRR